MDPRTLRAAIVAEVIAFASVLGIGLFLGFDLVPTLITAAILGTLAFILIVAAARRAESFEPPPGSDAASGYTPPGAPDVPPSDPDDESHP